MGNIWFIQTADDGEASLVYHVQPPQSVYQRAAARGWNVATVTQEEYDALGDLETYSFVDGVLSKITLPTPPPTAKEQLAIDLASAMTNAQKIDLLATFIQDHL